MARKIKSCKWRLIIVCLHEWFVGFQLNWKVTRVKNIDRWTCELVVLQGQIVIALLLSHATVSKTSALSLFHHIQHINKIAREWSEGDKEGKRRENNRERRRKKEKERGIQIDRLVARSLIVILGGWMNVFDGHCRFRQGECLKTREIGLGPREGNQCARGMWVLQCCSVRGYGGCLKFEGSQIWQLIFFWNVLFAFCRFRVTLQNATVQKLTNWI